MKQIKPNGVYDLKETSSILGIDRKTIYREIKAGNLETKKLGRGGKHIFLGENILKFLGSSTYSEEKK